MRLGTRSGWKLQTTTVRLLFVLATVFVFGRQVLLAKPVYAPADTGGILTHQNAIPGPVTIERIMLHEWYHSTKELKFSLSDQSGEVSMMFKLEFLLEGKESFFVPAGYTLKNISGNEKLDIYWKGHK